MPTFRWSLEAAFRCCCWVRCWKILFPQPVYYYHCHSGQFRFNTHRILLPTPRVAILPTKQKALSFLLTRLWRVSQEGGFRKEKKDFGLFLYQADELLFKFKVSTISTRHAHTFSVRFNSNTTLFLHLALTWTAAESGLNWLHFRSVLTSQTSSIETSTRKEARKPASRGSPRICLLVSGYYHFLTVSGVERPLL